MITKDTITMVFGAAQIGDIAQRLFPELKKKGQNLTGNCPFHQEKTASFAVSPSKNIYKCFGCGVGGGPIDLVMRTGKSFPDAIRYIAGLYGIEVKEDHTAKPDPEHDKKNELAATAASLSAHFAIGKKEDNPGRKYFMDRGFSAETIDEFQIGYCDGSAPELISPELLREIGATNEKGNLIFYKRATLPILDHMGRVVAFAGRKTDEKEKELPKYINSPDTPIYRKGKTLFNLHKARPYINQTMTVYIVEGYADVMAAWQMGVRNVVGLCGTALTADHLAVLNRFQSPRQLKFILAMDNETDPTQKGYKPQVAKAMYSALLQLLPMGEVQIVVYPSKCKDVGDMLTRGINLSEVQKVDAITQWVYQKFNADWVKTASPVEIAEGQEQVAQLIASVSRDNVRDVYINNLATSAHLTPKKLEEQTRLLRTEAENKRQNEEAEEHRYIKILDDYYERQAAPDLVAGSCTTVYVKRSVKELRTEGIRVGSIPRFHNWITEPEHLNYRRVIQFEHEDTEYRFFNRYQPLPYLAKPFDLPDEFAKDPMGFDYTKIQEIGNCARFFRHIANNAENGPWMETVLWDWAALLYTKPNQRQRAIALVSAEEGTGKSTFINLFLTMFGQNATKTEAARIAGKFNAQMADKILVAVEETKDEKGQIENILKDFITGFQKVVERKFADSQTITSFEKYIFASNHEDSFMKVGTTTTRFIVLKINSIPEGDRDKDFEQKLYREIPYLMHFLKVRGALLPGEDRLYHAQKYVENNALAKLRQASKDVVVQNMEELFSQIFLRCEFTEPTICWNTEYLSRMMQRYGGKMYEQKTPNYFQKVAVTDLRCFQQQTPGRFQICELEGTQSDNFLVSATWTYTMVSSKGRYIEFPIWKFVTPADVIENYEPGRIATLRMKIGEGLDRLTARYGEEPKTFFNTLTDLLATQKQLQEEEALPF